MEGAGQMGTLLNKFNSKKSQEGEKISKIIFTTLMLLLSISMIIPFILMISASFKHSADAFSDVFQLSLSKMNLDNYKEIFTNKYYFRWYLNSTFVVVMVIILKSIVVSMAAYAFAKLHFKGRDILFLMLMSAMMVTPDTTIVARYLLYKYLGLIDTLWVLIIPTLFGVYFVFLLRQFFMGIPGELSEAALIDGCSHFRIYYSIVLPLSKPAMLTMALFIFIWSWNDFVNPFVFITPIERQVITVGLQSFQNEYTTDISLQMAGLCMAVIPIIIIFAAVQKYFVEGIAATGIKG